MSYLSSLASRQLRETPMGIMTNWPWIVMYTASDYLSDRFFGEPTVSFTPGVDDFWSTRILRQTAYQCLIQGTQDTINNLIWNGGYTTNGPPLAPSDLENQPAISAYY